MYREKLLEVHAESKMHLCNHSDMSDALCPTAFRLAKASRVPPNLRQQTISEETCKVQSSLLVTQGWQLRNMPEIIAGSQASLEGHEQLQLEGVSWCLLEIILIIRVWQVQDWPAERGSLILWWEMWKKVCDKKRWEAEALAPWCKLFYFLLMPAGLLAASVINVAHVTALRNTARHLLLNFLVILHGMELGLQPELSFLMQVNCLEEVLQEMPLCRTALKDSLFGIWCIVLWSRDFLYEFTPFVLPSF